MEILVLFRILVNAAATFFLSCFLFLDCNATAQGLQRGGWNNRYFQYKGTIPYFVGIDLQQLASDKNIDFRGKIDTLAAYDINKVRIWLLCSFMGDVDSALFPYKRIEGKFDLESWDDEYWSRLREMVSYAKSRNVIVEISLFELHGLDFYFSRNSTTPYVFNRRYNKQEFGAPNYEGTFLPEFFDINYSEHGHFLLDIQKKLIDKTLSELAHFDNVYYEIMNEFPGKKELVENERVFSWAQNMAEYLKRNSSKIVTLHSHGYGYDRPTKEYARTSSFFWEKPCVDGLNFHLYSSDPNKISSILNSHQQKGKMLICNEGQGYYDIDRSAGYPNYRISLNRNQLNGEIRAAWGFMTSGGYYAIYHGPVPQLGSDGWTEVGSFAQAMRRIVETVPFWKMRPIRDDGSELDNLVIQGPALNWQVIADEGSAYLIYFWGVKTSQSVKISLSFADYTYYWYDVKGWKKPLESGRLSGGGLQNIPFASEELWEEDSGIVLTIRADQ